MLRPEIYTYLFLFLIFLAGCTGGSKKQESDLLQKSVVMDSSYLFDGKTLNRWKITNFGPQGPVYVSGGNIVLGMGDGCTGITYTDSFPKYNYEVTLEARRVAGNDFFCGMTFPVGNSPCTLIIGGWAGTVVGLSSIEGKDASENETTRLMKFELGKWYAIKLRVTEKDIKVWIGNEQIVDFTIDGKKLSIRPEVRLSKPFGIASWNTTAELRNIRLTRL
jgi:hypothetical protein